MQLGKLPQQMQKAIETYRRVIGGLLACWVLGAT